MSVVPADDEPNKPLAIAKVLGGTLVLVGAGVAVFIGARLKARNRAAFAIKTCPPSPGN
jgi:hypothetical protein